MLVAFELLIIGVTVVFVFLSIMVLAVQFTGYSLKKLNRFFPEKEEIKATSIQRVMAKHDDIAVAIAAVKLFMKK